MSAGWLVVVLSSVYTVDIVGCDSVWFSADAEDNCGGWSR